MLESRRRARDKAQSMKTKADLEEWLSLLNLTDEQLKVARMVFVKGMSRQQIAFATGYSLSQVKRMMAKILDKMA